MSLNNFFFYLLIFTICGSYGCNFSLRKSEEENQYSLSKIASTSEINVTGTRDNFHLLYYRLTLNAITAADIANQISKYPEEKKRKFLHACYQLKQNEIERAKSIILELSHDKPEFIEYYKLAAAFASSDSTFLKNLAFYSEENRSNFFTVYFNSYLSYLSGNAAEAVKLIQEFDSKFTVENSHKSNWIQLEALCNRSLGNYNVSNKLIDDLIKSSSDIAKIEFLPYAYNQKGAILYLEGNIDSAQSMFSIAFETAHSLANDYEIARSLVNLAIINDMLGEYEEAAIKFKKARILAEAINDPFLLGLTFSETAVHESYQNNINSAYQNFNKAIEYFLRAGVYERISFVYFNLGRLALTPGDFVSAENYFEKSLTYSKNLPVSKFYAAISLGDLYANLFDFSKALEFYNQATEITVKINSASLLNEVTLSKAILMINLGNTKKAIEILDEGLNRVLLSNDPYTSASFLSKAGLAFAIAGESIKADSLLDKAIFEYESIDAIYEAELTKLQYIKHLVNARNFNKAKLLLTEVKPEVLDFSEYILLDFKIVEAHIIFKSGDFTNASSKILEAESLAKNLKLPAALAELEMLRGQIYYFSGNLTEAEKSFKKANQLIEIISTGLDSETELKLSFDSDNLDAYSALNLLYSVKSDFNSLFLNIENKRGLSSGKKLFTLRFMSKTNDPLILQEYLRLKTLSENIFSDVASKLIAEKNFAGFKKLLEFKFPEISEIYQEPALENIYQAQKLLNENEYYLNWSVINDSLHLFLLSKSGLKTNTVNISIKEIDSLISNTSPYYSELSNEGLYLNQDLFSFNKEASFLLYNRVFLELLQDIPENGRLIVGSNSGFFRFPLEMLLIKYDEGTGKYNYKAHDFLINKIDIVYTPSLQYHAFLREKRGREKFNEVLIVGDVSIKPDGNEISLRRGASNDANNLSLYPLKFSKVEIESVSDLVGNQVVLSGKDATKENFLSHAVNSSIIHISTHSFQYDEQPFLLFSPSEKNSGIIEIADIVKLDLNADLVTISACKSAIGKEFETQGMAGLQKYFLDAGAMSCVVSLWDVSDELTAKFMTLFYNNLKKGISRSESLRKAKIEFAEKHSANPYFWAAFIISGDPGETEVTGAKNLQNNLLFSLSLLLISGVICGIFIKKNEKNTI